MRRRESEIRSASGNARRASGQGWLWLGVGLFVATIALALVALPEGLVFPSAERTRAQAEQQPATNAVENQLPGTTAAYPAPVVAVQPTTQVQLPTFNPNRSVVQAPPATAVLPTALPATAVPPTAAPPTAAPTTAVIVPVAGNSAGPGALARPASGGEGAPPPTAHPPAGPPPPNAIQGAVRWTINQSPVRIQQTTVVARGASLIIDPGVEVQIAPGTAIFVEGVLSAFGQPDRPVRFISIDPARSRWDAIYLKPGSTVILEQTELIRGGAGGVVIGSEAANLALRGVRAIDNGGQILANNSNVEIRDTEIRGSELPFGAVIELTYNREGQATLIGNRLINNLLPKNAPNMRVVNLSTTQVVNVDIQGNLLVGQSGPNLTLQMEKLLPEETTSNMVGNVVCNAFLNGTNGLSVRSQATQILQVQLNVRSNAIEGHTPTIQPIYLNRNGIGRGATSEVPLDMRENWWDDPSGPYSAERYADGLGEAVSELIVFEPWQTSRPECAPRP